MYNQEGTVLHEQTKHGREVVLEYLRGVLSKGIGNHLEMEKMGDKTRHT